MRLVICPGVHDRNLTDCFLAGLSECWAAAGEDRPFLCSHELTGESLVFVSFSAGVVGAIGAAWMWQQLGGRVGAFFALDGWGVPLGGNFTIHRLSHDRFTHWSSALLGSGPDSFWADPPIAHLDLWKSPHTATGWHASKTAEGIETAKSATAAHFIVHLLKQYGVN
jgi:hypothetical protein